MTTVNIGIIGFGTVGAGVVDCVLRNGELIGARTGINLQISRIADLDIVRDRGVSVADGVLTTDVSAVIDNPDIDVVVELVGGTGIAKEFILRALRNGKPVITANKALLAEHGAEIFAAAKQSSADIYYEASVGGGIPLIKAMREGLVGNKINLIVGILNGTCNYILTRMEREGVDFATVLGEAQAAGYAEAEPALDIDGIDTAHKATILASLAYGQWFGMQPLYVEGIRGIELQEIRYADKLGYRIKLLAIIQEVNGNIQLRVHPALVSKKSLLGNVNGVYNAALVCGDTVGPTMYYGRGAGRDATASAVVSDIVDVALNLKFGAHRRVAAFRTHSAYGQVMPMSAVSTRYYLRLQVVDQPGVLATIASIFAGTEISIASITQEEVGSSSSLPLVFLTHVAQEANMQVALERIGKLPEVVAQPVVLRIQDID